MFKKFFDNLFNCTSPSPHLMAEPQQTSPTSPKVLPEHDFYHYFGTVITDVFYFFRRIMKWCYRTQTRLTYFPYLPQFFDRANEKIEAYIPCWRKLKFTSDGHIAFHIYRCFYSMMRDPEFYNLSKYDRNILLWTILLHDICKRGSPEICGRDPIHPFKSAWQSLHYFNDTFKFISLTKEDLDEWDEIFAEGYVKKYHTEIQNHGILPKVKTFLDEKVKENNFVKEIIYYVLLHQSMCTISCFPHMSLLKPAEAEMPKYFDKRMFGLFRIFLRHDSFSYLIYYPEMRRKFGKEIDDNVKKLQGFMKDSLTVNEKPITIFEK